MLEEAESDVLLLFDCCSSGTANTDNGNGVTELIGACGFNGSANPVGSHSFTRAMITELRLLSASPAFTVGVLYNKILNRVQMWMPEGREMQKPPLYVILTQNWRLPRSIQLSAKGGSRASRNLVSRQVSSSQTSTTPSTEIPKTSTKRRRTCSAAPSNVSSKRRRTRNSSPGYLHSPDSTLSSQDSTPGTVFEPSSSLSSASSLSSQEDLYPKIAVTIRLKETLEISEASANLFAEWMEMMPLLAEHVKVEASFSSFSTLLMVSLTIPLWCYLENHPAITLEGLIRSSNQLAIEPALTKTRLTETVQPHCDPTTNLKPTPRTLRWGVHAEALIQLYKFNFVEGEARFELSPTVRPTGSVPETVYLESTMFVDCVSPSITRTDFGSGPDPPYKCALCQTKGQSNFDGAENLAMHHIACHSIYEPNLSPRTIPMQITNYPASSRPQNQQNFHASSFIELEESVPVVASSAALPEDGHVRHNISAKNPGTEETPHVNEGGLTSTTQPIAPHGLSKIPNKSDSLEKAVEGQIPPAFAEIETLIDQGQHTNLVAEMVEIQPHSSSLHPSSVSSLPVLKNLASATVKCPQDQDLASQNARLEADCGDSIPSAVPGITPTAYGDYMDMTQNSQSQESVSTFLSIADSAYVSYESSDNRIDHGYYSQLMDSPEYIPDTASTRPPLGTFGSIPDIKLLKLYKFLAPKGQQPYFQLRQEYEATPENPERVYLGLPK